MNDQLDDRVFRLEQRLNDSPLQQVRPYDYDIRIPAAENVEWVSSTVIASGGTKVILRWIKPHDQTIDHFEVWVSRHVSSIETPVHVISVEDSPASFSLKPDQDTNAVGHILTVMRNGLRTRLNAAPTVTFPVYV